MFKKVYIEISDICGLSCSFCPHPKNIRKTMPLELFYKACIQSKPLTQSIALHLLGDPCKLKNLSDYLEIAFNLDLRIDLVTSGFYLDPKDFDKLLSPPISQVAISLNAGFDRQNFRSKNYLENIFDFCHYKLAKNTEGFINLRIQEATLKDLSWLKERILKEFGIQEMGLESRYRLGKKVFLNITKTFEWPKISTHTKPKMQKYCYGLISQVGILSNGVVVPCCIDGGGEIDLGNLYHQNLSEILATPRAVAIKEGFIRGIASEELCKHCSYPARGA